MDKIEQKTLESYAVERLEKLEQENEMLQKLVFEWEERYKQEQEKNLKNKECLKALADNIDFCGGFNGYIKMGCIYKDEQPENYNVVKEVIGYLQENKNEEESEED